jgi:long-subunit acyl-CoA synthetase (AMP-forming)
VISGGVALPEWVSRGLEDIGPSETSPILTLNPPHSPRLFEVNERGEGEIAAKGPMVMKGYYKNEKATKVFDGGYWVL